MVSRRAPLLAGAFVLLALATLGGLARLGWPLPAPAGAAAHHGALMVGGFFGTLIALERAVAVRLAWAFAAPALAAAGGLALALGAPQRPAQGAMVAAAVVLAAASLVVCRRLSAAFTWTIAAGAGAWLAGNVAWLIAGAATDAVLLCWLGFFVLTIAGERLELSRVAPKPPIAQPLFVALVLAQCGAIAAALAAAFADPGAAAAAAAGAGAAAARVGAAGVAFAATCAGLAAWLFRWDLARRTVRAQGLTRYMAVALLGGHAWLLAGAALLGWLWAGDALPAPPPGGALRDAALHGLLLGFVFSMVFAHAFAILPSVAAIRLAWRPLAYLPLGLLQVSVLLRVAGDLGGWLAARQWGALLSAASLAAFVATIVACALAARRRSPAPPRRGARRVVRQPAAPATASAHSRTSAGPR